jgi:glycosyltransferase involved in cell wall biosynthesis
VHVHNVPDFLVFAAILPKLAGARVILDIHDIQPELYAGKFGAARGSMVFRSLLSVERLSCRFADYVIVANHIWHERLIVRAVRPEKCLPLINYPDLRVFKPRPAGAKRETDKFIVLYPGTLNYHQGLDIAVRAFALAKDRMPNAELHIYGEGPAQSELARLTRECGLEERIKLLDPLPIDQMSSVIALADVGVEPKRAEGFGDEALSTKILEFMACRVPVVVSRTTAHAHYFDASLVRFFAPGQPGALAEALIELYDQRSNVERRVDSAQNFAIRHSWQERMGDYGRVLDTLMAKSRRSRTAFPQYTQGSHQKIRH